MKPAHCQSPGTAHTTKPRFREVREITCSNLDSLRRRNCRSRSHPSCCQIPSIRERILEPGTDAADLKQAKGRYGGAEAVGFVEEAQGGNIHIWNLPS